MPQIYRIFVNAAYELEITDAYPTFKKMAEQGDFDKDILLGEGVSGRVSKCKGKAYVVKEYFNSNKEEDIIFEVITFALFYRGRNVYIQLSGGLPQVYFPIAGYLTLGHFLRGTQFNLFDLLSIDFALIPAQIEALQKIGLYHQDPHTDNFVIGIDNRGPNSRNFSRTPYKPNLIDFGYSLTDKSQYPKDSQFQSRFTYWVMKTIEKKAFGMPKRTGQMKRLEVEGKWLNFAQQMLSLLYGDGTIDHSCLELKRNFQKTIDCFGIARIAVKVARKLDEKFHMESYSQSNNIKYILSVKNQIKNLIAMWNLSTIANFNNLLININKICLSAFDVMVDMVDFFRDNVCQNANAYNEHMRKLKGSIRSLEKNYKIANDFIQNSTHNELALSNEHFVSDIRDHQSQSQLMNLQKQFVVWFANSENNPLNLTDEQEEIFNWVLIFQCRVMINVASQDKARQLERLLAIPEAFNHYSYSLSLFILSANESSVPLFQKRIVGSCELYIKWLLRLFFYPETLDCNETQIKYMQHYLRLFFGWNHRAITKELLENKILSLIERLNGKSAVYMSNDPLLTQKIAQYPQDAQRRIKQRDKESPVKRQEEHDGRVFIKKLIAQYTKHFQRQVAAPLRASHPRHSNDGADVIKIMDEEKQRVQDHIVARSQSD